MLPDGQAQLLLRVRQREPAVSCGHRVQAVRWQVRQAGLGKSAGMAWPAVAEQLTKPQHVVKCAMYGPANPPRCCHRSCVAALPVRPAAQEFFVWYAPSDNLAHGVSDLPEAPGVVTELLLLDQRQLLPSLRIQERLPRCWSLARGEQPHPHRAEDQCEGDEGDLHVNVCILAGTLKAAGYLEGGGAQ